MANIIIDAFELVRSSKSLSFAKKELSKECTKLKEYSYSTRQIKMVYEHLMVDDAQGWMFFGMDDELRKEYWVNDFFDSVDQVF